MPKGVTAPPKDIEGKMIMDARKAKGLTKAKLGDMAGVSWRRISQLESDGINYPLKIEDEPITRALGLDIHKLLNIQAEGSELESTEDDDESGQLSAAFYVPPRKVYGHGSFSVYAWFLPRYELKSQRFPIKVGSTSKSLNNRLVNDITVLPERPVVCFHLLSDTKADMVWWETTFHRMLESYVDAPGTEWVKSRPEEILDLYQSLSKFGR